MNVRRVVTGHNAEGKAMVASDEDVEPVTVSLVPGVEFHRLWGADAPPSFPDDGSQPAHAAYFPPVGGFRFGLCSMAPATSAAVPDDLDLTAALAELEQKLPGMAAYMEPDASGMHRTATVDYEYVLEGEVVLELDGGAEVTLRPGDSVVQNGTRHAWHNRGDTTARLVVVIVGANHSTVPGAWA
jgi:quercetin dioxygenase-like cupin family protein